MTDSLDRWAGLDDTLHEPAGEPVRLDAEARDRLIEQRLVHGLLRLLHTADAAGREARIQAILERLAPEPVSGRRRLLVAAMVALLLAAGLFLVPGEPALPEAEAMVSRAQQVLAEPLDRRFTLSLLFEDKNGERRLRNQYTLTMRPGGRFLLHGEMLLTSFECGSDGVTFWYLPRSPFAQRVSMPVEKVRESGEAFGDMLELGYLDIHDLIARLPEGFRLESTGRQPPRRPGGPPLLRVEAVAGDAVAEPELESAWLLFEEETGMVAEMEVVSRPVLGRRKVVVFEYQGEVRVGDDAYRRPW